jgi:effector-binding domain-containing protein
MSTGTENRAMMQEPQIQARPEQPYAGVRTAVSMDGISGAVDEAFPVLFGWLGENGVPPSGPPFIRYLVIDMAAQLKIELGVPVSVPIAGTTRTSRTARVQPGVLPAGRYAVLRHSGPYDGLVAANAALQEWAREHEITFDAWETPDGLAWRSRVEHYLTDPSKEPDPAKWEVDVAYLTS